MNQNYFAIIMAGGVGSRFWPVSKRSFPKQFHDMLGTGESLLQTTFSRLNGFIPEEQIYILTNAEYDQLVKDQLPSIGANQIVLEPAMRNTAPCILMAAMKINKINPNALMIVAPSDHWIEDQQSFRANVEEAFHFASNQEALLTLGIRPSFPNTGYGYIEYDKEQDSRIKTVSRFMEKPDYKTAQRFLEQGNYLWNAGIFVWSAKSVIKAFESYQPDLFNLFDQGDSVYNTDFEDDFLRENYEKADNISVDYAIMEHSDKVFVLPAEFDWNDLGTWGSLYDKLDKKESGNAVVNARTLTQNASGNMIRTSSEKIVVVEDLNNFIIVDEDEVLLIVPKEKEQDIKQILQKVKDRFGDTYG
ncbi:MAG: mannose-1-phosphate guanylyltransferase [Bacteroidia bacterium]|nr:mannose-1-phosphate guanylyltransferase [Bacteroidia bacterium]MBT8269069.1 mannose-1-phosphate guanylyltransferase [Bacteroidia bacterium]NNK69860.1 mannose-1-phosphate guanylyltransferase [Flavobacteriaceae bacterium]NNL81042.1 mannose-1-phosphate guanylyltransferase [Flavobacteriaceae bacterium]